VKKGFQMHSRLWSGISKISGFLWICLLVLPLTTACGTASAAQYNSGSLQDTSSGISSAKKSSQDFPKGEQPKASRLKENQGQQPQVAETQAPAFGEPSVSAQSGTNGEPLPSATAVSDGASQDNLPTPISSDPMVDLSIPAEPRVGARAPDFSMPTIDGKSLRLADFLGRPFLLNYWATWCVPCKNELPILQKIYVEYKKRGLLIATVDAIEQDDRAKVQSVAKETKLTMPILLDNSNQFYKNYQVQFFPTTFFVDARGVIRQITLGDSTEQRFREEIEKLLTGKN